MDLVEVRDRLQLDNDQAFNNQIDALPRYLKTAIPAAPMVSDMTRSAFGESGEGRQTPKRCERDPS